MKVLLSIKPQFADKIFDGSKKFEFRKSIFKDLDIKTVIVYASSPVKKAVGEFEIEHTLMEEPVVLWKKTKKYSGISEDFFFDYFLNKKIGYAIKIKKTKKYRRPFCIKERFNVKPPQSYMYI